MLCNMRGKHIDKEGKNMNILISIDSFKGSMTSMQAGNAAKKEF